MSHTFARHAWLALVDPGALDAATEQLEVMAISANGDAVYLQQFGAVRKALRWTRAGGFQELGGLNGRPCTEISFPDIGGARVTDGLVVGSSSSVVDSTACGWKQSRAVVWDAQGPRDIATELERAGVDLEGLSLKRADYVWSGPRVRVHGYRPASERGGSQFHRRPSTARLINDVETSAFDRDYQSRSSTRRLPIGSRQDHELGGKVVGGMVFILSVPEIVK